MNRNLPDINGDDAPENDAVNDNVIVDGDFNNGFLTRDNIVARYFTE